MKLPTRLATSLAAVYAAVVVLSNEIADVPHWAHQLIIAAGVILAAFTIHPAETGIVPGEVAPVAGASTRPTPPPAPGRGGEPL